MPLVELNKQVIYGNFFSALHNGVEAIGIDTGKPETLETAFQIKGLITAIDATYYFADWRFVLEEYQKAGGWTEKRYGFNLTAGPPDHELQLRYFPEIWRGGRSTFSPEQPASLYISQNNQGLLEGVNDVIIKGCTVSGGKLIFGCKRGGKIKTITILLREGECIFNEPGTPPSNLQANLF